MSDVDENGFTIHRRETREIVLSERVVANILLRWAQNNIGVSDKATIRQEFIGDYAGYSGAIIADESEDLIEHPDLMG